jgi:hypothetical protein
MRCKERFAHNLKILMARDGVSGKQLAETVGIKPANVSRWLAAIQWPDGIYLDQMSDVYGWRVEELFSETTSDRVKGSTVELREAVEIVLDSLGFEKTKLVKRSS